VLFRSPDVPNLISITVPIVYLKSFFILIIGFVSPIFYFPGFAFALSADN
jgi:hypothetical protein